MVEFESTFARGGAPSCLFALLLFASAPWAPLAAQARFVERATPVARQRAGLAFDILRGRMVLLGGFTGRTGAAGGAALRDTWEQEASGWVRRAPLSLPPVLDQATALAYDFANKRIVYFGSQPGTGQMETWRYDGRNWSRFLGLTNSPQFRQNYATAFDSARGVMVLFGGSDTTGPFPDTWEFDGLDWRQVAATGPTGRDDAVMAYDGARNRVILFGGRGPGQLALNDTWEWNGTAWSPLTPLNTPPRRHSAAMAFDPARNQLVLFGGVDSVTATRFDDTWVWNGTDWAQRSPVVRPAARNGHAIAYRSDRNRVVIFAGDGTNGLLSDTWEWDGTTWVETIAAPAPDARVEHAACFDANRGEVLLFGGKDAANVPMADTWAWRMGSWRELSPGVSPPARSDHAMEFDAARGQAVLFGGWSPAGVLADTWIWNGAVWSQANPANVPPARMGHTMGFDPLRQVTVLFGGTGSSGALDDVWEWSGSNWAARTPAVRPSARSNHGMAYDPINRQLLLFGGRNATGGKLNDTWLWDGAAGVWTQRVVSPLPAARDSFAMYFDAARQRVALFAGFGTSSYVSDSWEWNGSGWASVFVFPSPQPRQGMPMTYDGASRNTLLFGGLTTTGPRQETWLFTTNPIALVVPHGRTCAGPSGSAILAGFGAPTIGSSSFAIELISPTPPTILPVFFLLAALPGSVTFGSCTLGLDPASVFYTTHRLQFGVGFASMALPIPPSLSLRGVTFYAAAAYVDPPTQVFGLAFSQQARIVIGD